MIECLPWPCSLRNRHRRKIMESLDSPFIARLVRAFDEDQEHELGACLLLEYCPGGSLRDWSVNYALPPHHAIQSKHAFVLCVRLPLRLSLSLSLSLSPSLARSLSLSLSLCACVCSRLRERAGLSMCARRTLSPHPSPHESYSGVGFPRSRTGCWTLSGRARAVVMGVRMERVGECGLVARAMTMPAAASDVTPLTPKPNVHSQPQIPFVGSFCTGGVNASALRPWFTIERLLM